MILRFRVQVWDVRSVHPSGRVSWAVGAGRERIGTPAHLYPERGGVYFNIPRASRQRALIINKLGTRHGVPQGDQPEQSQNRETDRERRACVEESERGIGGKERRRQRGADRRDLAVIQRSKQEKKVDKKMEELSMGRPVERGSGGWECKRAGVHSLNPQNIA